MSADRSEKLTITRSLKGTVVRLVVTENGVTVNYSVKSYESTLPESIRNARKGVDRLLAKAEEA